MLAHLEAVGQNLAALAEPLRALVAYLQTEADGHFVVEERMLFPKLVAHADVETGTVSLLVDEHAAVRTSTCQLDEALQHGTVACQVAAAEALIDLLRAHVAKEETMLLAVAAVTPNL